MPAIDRADLRRGLVYQGKAWGLALAILVATSVIAVLLNPLVDGEVSSGLIFVLGITLVGASSGLVPALICALIASAIFNFFLAEPVLTFRMSTGDDLAPPVLFTMCALVSGLLSGRLKDQSFQAQQSNIRLQSLLEASRNLQGAKNETEVLEALESTVPAKLGANLAIYRFQGAAPVPVGRSPDEPGWTTAARLTAEAKADFLRLERLSGYLLTGGQGSVGVLVSDEPEQAGVDRNFMLALSQVVGLALERAQLAAKVAEVQALARTEELKSALLSSVSHDLRTPLTTISTSASSLLAFGDKFDAETSRQLLGGIVEECDRLNHLTANLLEMTRLQGGGANLRRSVLPASEMIRNIAARLKRQAGGRTIRVSLPKREVAIEADTALFELALANVVQNAQLYSPPGSAITLSCGIEENDCVISVTDEGVGISADEQDKVFGRFYRIERSDGGPKGTGLGLAIAKGFVEASNGTISVKSPVADGRGTRVTIRLPLAQEHQNP